MSDLRLKRTISSALWSAYADALGFPTELASDKIVQQRLGHSTITRTEPWKRLVGGRFGATVSLPAGAYSDDTQLRLATSRAIRGNGYFDVEAFAKIELTVWQAYALGAGRGSKAAAAALCNRSNTWFSNFFANYENGGGNGAAMRIQPHVWAATNLKDKASYVPDVIRNALCTHGHMRGIAGAVIHAVSLAHTFETGKPPSPEQWPDLADDIRAIPKMIAGDNELMTFWVPTWAQRSNQSLEDAVATVAREWEDSARNVASILMSRSLQNSTAVYEEVVKAENGLSTAERGSGLKCALFANVAAWISPQAGAQESIQMVANLLDSDTDTIGTMAGALIGAAYPDASYLGPVQDDIYIRDEAERLYGISQGRNTYSFSYPDMLYWQPPRTMIDILGIKNNHFHIDGLGDVNPIGAPFLGQKGTSWQWFLLSTGQTVLSRFRADLIAKAPLRKEPALEEMDTPDLFEQAMENKSRKLAEPFSVPTRAQVEVETIASDIPIRKMSSEILPKPVESHATDISPNHSRYSQEGQESREPLSLDDLTNEAIRGFDPQTIGRHILMLAEQPNAIELSIAYSAVVVKARSARLKYKNRNG
ncbi:ADP-ribosylglycohydrolase family protein [Pseudomonas chlororaphis]|uniref:ADP-ribosylglycohydrolase family protein n=1 Tax=Pseudomonas chlororaphis TaxID=587753 RepID=UPI001925D154|nr:ADP-ribosylglycohydrolase family protein [Pseudomonas chlororaphis]QQX61098.1 ADP-ribosylglycohydrolase family protein [Pseudomonas chlororaphis subsp. aurantiaca]